MMGEAAGGLSLPGSKGARYLMPPAATHKLLSPCLQCRPRGRGRVIGASRAPEQPAHSGPVEQPANGPPDEPGHDDRDIAVQRVMPGKMHRTGENDDEEDGERQAEPTINGE